MSTITGSKKFFFPVRETRTQVVVSYGLTVGENGNATWHEVYFDKKAGGRPDIAVIRQSIVDDIDKHTQHRILSGLVWNGKPVWLSVENQLNWKAAYDQAVQTDGANLPLKFKLGETEDGTPVYHTFTSLNAFGDFHSACQQHIQQSLQEGYQIKDSIDWSLYER